MRKYCVRFYNDVTKEIYEVWELNRVRFTKHDYDNIVLALFEKACEGIDNRSLFADLYSCSADELVKIPMSTLGCITVACETLARGSIIDAHIFVNCTHVRKMSIVN